MKSIRISAMLAVAALCISPVISHSQGMMMGGPNTRSNPLGLLMRSDVQREISLGLRQKTAIEELQQKSQVARQQKMGAVMQNVAAGLRNANPQDRQAQMQDVQTQMETAMNSLEGELSEQIKKILKPEQVTRLHELDLQKRGPIALSDSKVQEELKITQPSRSEIAKLVAVFNTKQREIMMTGMQQLQQNGGGIQPGQRPTQQKMQEILAPLQKKVADEQTATEELIVTVLTPEESETWTKALGVKFRFRTDI